ncbi:uncharacterized protein F5147DRAFT_746521 [Suillus discolor]|uniref:Ubiquitin-like protease family profile domain-containing protein n=1 Tax=Suillus discolor TaxID=1912936 RepID=A0A9P7JSC7_9AGAM|nr:uncharacterized protein F5147DRAFT_746521 [Suillus discolor]KAG2104683.1 hypothetical protein F5147DRAFT_746521 [Suillus discolor]
MARDLKINIRKRTIGSFFEWDKLDRAVGGAQQALGTKLHQQTRKAIAKRQPALMTAIRKFNSYCEHLESLYDPSWGIPLPMALPTKLTLMEDVWITPSAGDIPRWLDDSDVRGGIRALLKHDQCQEEQQHLSIEAENLCHYFGDELCALELALSSDTTSAKEAADLAKTLTRGATGANLSWINHPLTLEIDYEEDDIPDFEAGPSDVDAHQIAFVDFLEEDSVANEDIEDIAEVGKASITICWVVPEYLDISFLGSPTARLNDVCINGCAILLHDAHMSTPVAQHIAILSTHNLPLWILPIHRPAPVGHWVLCIIYRSSKEFHLFDSFAEERCKE